MKRQFSLHRFLSQALRLPMAGPVFKLYAPRRRWKRSSGSPPRQRILIANLMPSLGDTICYMALVEVLRDALPEAEITWLADSAMAGLVAQHPDIDRVLTITIPPSRLLRIPTLGTYYRLYNIMRSILGMQLDFPFNIAIVPRGGVDPSFSAHAVWMLNLPRSAGYSHLVEPADIDHHFGDPLVTDLEATIPTLHEAARGIHLLELIGVAPGALQHFTPESTLLRGLHAIASSVDYPSLLQKAGIPANQPFMVLSSGAGLPRKTWPAHKFRELTSRILTNSGMLVVLTGSKTEVAVADTIADGLGDRVINTAGKLNLTELIALISHAAAFVGNDSGAGHIAGPLGIPLISLHVQAKNSDPYYIHAPEHYRPLGPHVTILQPEHFLAPCTVRCESTTVHCLDQITVDQVWTALERTMTLPLLHSTASPSST